MKVNLKFCSIFSRNNPRLFKVVIFFFLLFSFNLINAQKEELPDAPDFTSQDIDGNIACLDSLLKRGPVFMSFWALWCEMCIKELDALRPYYDEFDSLGLQMLAINEDKARAVPKVKPFALSHKWRYTLVLDPENILRELYNVLAMPTSFIVNQKKKIVFVHQGYKPGDEKIIAKKVRELMNKDRQESSFKKMP